MIFDGFRIALALIALGLSATAAMAQQQASSSSVGDFSQSQTLSTVVVVNDEAITNRDLTAKLRFEAIKSGADPDTEMSAERQRELLNDLINQVLKLQEAKKSGIEVPRKDLDQRITAMAKRSNQSGEDFLIALEKEGVPRSIFLHDLEANIAWQRLVIRRLPSASVIKPDDLNAEVEEVKQRRGQIEKNIVEIYLPFDPNVSRDTTIALAQSLYEQLQRSTPFTTLAAQYSKAPSAGDGGVRGWTSRDELPPELVQYFNQIAVQDVTKPLLTSDGLWIMGARSQRTIGQRAGPTLLNMKQLFLSLPENVNSVAAQQKLALAAQVTSDVRGCERFNQSMISFGDQGSGDLNRVPSNSLPARVAQIVTRLPQGQPSPPLPVPGGASIFMVCSKQDQVNDIDEAEIRSSLIDQKAERYADRLLREVRRKAFIEIRAL